MNQTNQQGDVIFERAAIPADAKERNSKVVREGKGHHAHVMEGDVEMFEKDGTIYVRVGRGGATIQHQQIGGGPGEHRTQTIAPGEYKTPGVVEWNPWDQEARRVED